MKINFYNTKEFQEALTQILADIKTKKENNKESGQDAIGAD